MSRAGLAYLPADQYVGHCGPLHWAVAAERKAGLTVDVLRVADVRAVVALVDGHVYPGSFRVRLRNKSSNVTHQVSLAPTARRNVLKLFGSVFQRLRTDHVAEDEARVREFEVLEQAVELAAVQGAPGTVEVISGLRLLPRVVVVQELKDNRSRLLEGKSRVQKLGGTGEEQRQCCT